VRFGVLTFVTDEGIGPVELGAALEQRGLSRCFLPSIRTSRLCADPYPLARSDSAKYYRTLDPFVALTAAAVATEKLVVAPDRVDPTARSDPDGQRSGVPLIWCRRGDFDSVWRGLACVKRSPTMALIPGAWTGG